MHERGCELFFFVKKRSTSSLALAPHPVPHMAPPTPSAGISVSVCGRSGQCFRSYPRNYTSVWLSAPAPGPQDVGTRYQTLLIACRLLTSLLLPIRYPTPTPLPVWPALFTRPLSLSLSVLPSSISRRITNTKRRFAP